MDDMVLKPNTFQVNTFVNMTLYDTVKDDHVQGTYFGHFVDFLTDCVQGTW